MAENQPTPEVTAETYSQSVVDAMIEALRAATSPEMMQAQIMLAKRLALSGDVVPSRIPPPKNITEIGGYLNLLANEKQPELRAQVLASIFGVAGPNPPVGWLPTQPVLFFATRSNDRTGPTPEQQAAIPVSFSIRSDFAGPFELALKEIRDKGCELPILSPNRSLPPAPSPGSNGYAYGGAAEDMLRCIGRTLEMVPSAALRDPDADPLALAHTAVGPLEVVALQLNAAAPRAGEVVADQWTAWKCTSAACQEDGPAQRTYLPVGPILNQAGWFQPVPGAPTSLADGGSWNRWTNVTGLVAGQTTYGEELRLLHTDAEIAMSSLRDRLSWVWNGSGFAAQT